jgi:tetratricopeptide (TPR) repeat protein
LQERLLDARAGALGARRVAEAEAALRAARRLDPAEARASNALGALLQGAPGRWREAREAYEAAIRAQPLGGDAYHNLGTVLQRLGDHAAAKARHAPTTATAAAPQPHRSPAMPAGESLLRVCPCSGGEPSPQPQPSTSF